MNVLITGHNGFIGSHLYAAILNLGHAVIGWDTRDGVDGVNGLIESAKMAEVIFHLGAHVDTLDQDVNFIMESNFELSMRLFDQAEKQGAKVIYASSAAAYGVSGTPSNLYGWSKYCAEQYGIKACSKFVSLRYFNCYGPGEEHKGRMASVATQAMQSEFFSLFPGKPSRDFVYVFDVVNANLWAMDYVDHGIFEVGSGESRTFEDVLKIIGVSFDYLDESDIPPGYQMKTQSDPKKWMHGWKPRYTIEAGLDEYRIRT